MTETDNDGNSSGKRYVAFLSYASADRKTARWLHRNLERYRTPKRLQREHGAPTRLIPIFRDRDELPAGGHLPDRLTEALKRSEHLIVLCSPNAAESKWVSMEVATFKAQGKGERIIPVFADDVAIDSGAAETFPPALRFAMDGDVVSDRPDPEERLVADLREVGDGKRGGLLKIVAGLIGVGFGEVKQREVAAQRRRTRFAYGLVGIFALLTVVASVSAWRAVEQTRIAENAQRSVEEQLTRAEAALLTVLNGVSDIVNQVSAGAERGEITTAVANGLLQIANTMVQGVGETAAADPRLKMRQASLQQQLSRHYARVGQSDKAREAAAYATQLVEELAGVSGYEHWAFSARASVLVDHGDTLLRQGQVEEALAAYNEGLTLRRDLAGRDPNNLGYQRDVSVSLDRIADVLLRQGQVEEALAAYNEGLTTARDLTGRDPYNLRYQRDVSVSLNKVADVLLRQGQVSEALAAYNEVLTTARDLAGRDPNNLGYQRDASVSLDRIADVLLRQGQVSEALAAYNEGLTLRRDLAGRDPNNLGYQRDVSVSLDRIADVLLRQGEVEEALAAYNEALITARDLAGRDPNNLGYQFDVSVSLDRIADVLLRQGEVEEALAAYNEGLTLRRDLAGRDPNNLRYQRALSVSLDLIADVLLRQQGEVEEALAAYNESLTLRRDLAVRDPNNLRYQRDASVSLERIADVLLRQGEVKEALAAYNEGLTTARDLAGREPNNLGYQRDVFVSLTKLANVLLRQGQVEQALAAYNEGLTIARDLAGRDPSNLGYKVDVAISNAKLALLARDAGDEGEECARFAAANEAFEDALAVDPTDVRVKGMLDASVRDRELACR